MIIMASKKQLKTNRHSTAKKSASPPVSPPFISTGKHDKKILRSLLKNSIKKYSHRSNYLNLGISKSSYTDSLKRMAKNKLLILRENYQKPIVTELGKGMAELPTHEPQGVAEGLATHKLEYKIYIKDGDKFPLEKLNNLKETIKSPYEYYLGKNRIVNLYYQQETIVIHTHCLKILVHELLGDTEQTHIKGFNIALQRLQELQKIGLETQNKIELEDAHYEIMKNAFTEVLNDIENNFKIKLDNGEYLWIDHSKKDKKDEGSQGLESNNPEVRDSANNLFNDVYDGHKDGHRFKDIGEIKDDLQEIKKALKLCTQNFTTILNIEKERLRQPIQEELKEKPHYIQ